MYQLTERVAVYGLGEPKDGPGIVIVPHESNAVYPWWSESTQTVLREMENLPLEGASVLDFGCGSAAILGLAAVLIFGAARADFIDNRRVVADFADKALLANGQDGPVLAAPPQGHWDFAFANVGDAALVGEVSLLATHGIGTGKEGDLIQW